MNFMFINLGSFSWILVILNATVMGEYFLILILVKLR